MLFVNISCDKINIQTNDESWVLDGQDIEKSLPAKLKEIYNEHKYTKILVVNGPGSFTTLRVGSLSLNMLNFVYDDQIDIISVDKISLYKRYVNKGLLPTKGIVYIGQKTKVRVYNFDNDEYNVLSIDEIKVDESFFVDQVFEVDEIKSLGDMISFSLVGEDIQVDYNQESLGVDHNEFGKKQKYISTNYMIQPSIG